MDNMIDYFPKEKVKRNVETDTKRLLAWDVFAIEETNVMFTIRLHIYL